MIDLFYEGGVLFMSIVTIGLIMVLVTSIRGGLLVFGNSNLSEVQTFAALDLIKSAGLFAAVCGILGQMIGMYTAFQAIQAAGDVAPALIWGGLRVSFITTLYGTITYVISLAIWILLRFLYKSK